METRNIFYRGDSIVLVVKAGAKERTYRGMVVALDPFGVELQDRLGDADMQMLNNPEEIIVADSKRGYAFKATVSGIEEGVIRLKLQDRHESRRFFRVETMLEFGYDIVRRAGRELPPEKQEREGRIDDFFKKAQDSEQKDNPLLAMMMYMYEELRELRGQVYTMKSTSEEDTRTPVQRMADLSASGIRFVTETEHNKGDRLRFYFTLPNSGQPIVAEGMVLRADMEFGKKGTLSVACDFTHLEENDRETIIQFVFQAQRQKLRRSDQGARSVQ